MEMSPKLAVSLACIIAGVHAVTHPIHKEASPVSCVVPLMLEGIYATAGIIRSLNETTVYISAFDEDFILDIKRSPTLSLLSSMVETSYKASGQPFSRKTPLVDDCLYLGTLRGNKNSAVFVDACSSQISGTIYIDEEKLVISPLDKKSYLYKITRLTSADELHEEKGQEVIQDTLKRRQRRQRQATQAAGGNAETKYLELYIVHDYQEYVNNRRDLEALKIKSTTMTHLIGLIYQNLNIKVTLVGSEVWNEGDAIRVSSNVYDTLDRFLAWREEELLPRQPHDFALLVSGTTFMHHMKAHTYHGEMCSQSYSATILEDYTEDVVQVANDAAHSMGHNLGLRHDTPECECDDPTDYCVMDIVKSIQPPVKFSTCSRELLLNHLAMGWLTCLNNVPAVPRGPLCGNGLLEAGEECDCGEPRDCSDVCCISSECVRVTDCTSHSSQILAAPQIVTAPVDESTTERQTTQVTTGISSLSQTSVGEENPSPLRVDELVEEKFNAINVDAALTSGILQAATASPLKVETTTKDGTSVADENYYISSTAMASPTELATKAATTSEQQTMTAKTVVTKQQQVTSRLQQSVNMQSVEGSVEQRLPANIEGVPGNDPDMEAACATGLEGTAPSNDEFRVLGAHASINEILQILGIQELDEPPKFFVEPEKELYVVNGRDLELSCEASGLSVISYTWLKDGEEIDIYSDPRMTLHRGNLTIQFPDSSDIGVYQCLASNIYTTAVSSKSQVMRAAMGRFSSSPGTIRKVEYGDSVVLPCNPPLSIPPPLVSWALNSSGAPIRYSRRISQDPKGNLVIANVAQEDTGLYHCIVVNEVMAVKIESPRINLIVRRPARPPVLVYSPEETKTALQGERLSLKCLAIGNPAPQMWWERHGADLPFNRSSHTSFGQELLISSLSVADGGVYRCIADNGVGSRTEATVVLTVKAPPFWIAEPNSLTVPVGASATFTCEAGGDPVPDITWLINNQPAYEVSQSLQLDMLEGVGHGWLQMNETTNVDSSSAVQCVATSRFGQIISNAHLTVLALAAMFTERPPSEKVVLEGEVIMIPCRGLGAPRPTISWWKNSNEVVESNGRLRIQSDGTFMMCNAELSDEGEYTCMVDNKYGYETWVTSLYVRRRTRITKPPVNIQLTVGELLLLPCGVTSDPALDVDIGWETPASGGADHELVGDGSLRIPSVSLQDHGLYTCIAETVMDRTVASAFVVVEEPPASLLCGNLVVDPDEDCDPGPYNTLDPDPCCSADCLWIQDVQCSGHQCVSGLCVPFCEAQGLSSCECTFDGESCYRCCAYDGVCMPYVDSSNGNLVHLPDDTACSTGTCQQGVCTSLAEATTTTAPVSIVSERPTPEPIVESIPNPPADVMITTLSSPLDVQLSWSNNEGDSVYSYEVEAQTAYSHGMWSLLTSVPGNQTLARLSLFPYVTYLFRVVSVNGAGRSEVSETTGQFFTPPARPVSNPRNVSTVVRDGLVIIEWEAMRPEEHGAPLFSYNVLWRPLGSESWNREVLNMFQHSYAIPGSETNRVYEIAVQATNAVGLGPDPETFTYGSYAVTEATTAVTPPFLQIVIPPPETVRILVGSRLVLPCKAEGVPEPRIEWVVNGASVQNGEQLYVDESGSLVIDPADRSNTGLYECRAINPSVGEIRTVLSNVTVTAPMLAFVTRPPATLDVLVNERLELQCGAEGFPQPSVSWRFNSQEIAYGADTYMAENNSIIIPSTNPSHSGLYQCIISNGLHNIKTVDSIVIVRDPLQVSIQPKEIFATPGSYVTLPCTIIHDLPLVRAYWKAGMDERPIPNAEYRQNSESYPLVISLASVQDSNRYTCVAETILDSQEDSVQLIVQTAPDPPSELRTTNLSDSAEEELTFTPGFDGNSAIISYLVEYSSPEGEVPWQLMKNVTAGESPIIVVIPPYYSYYLRARAVNKFGTSQPSNVMGPVYAAPVAPDRNPSNIHVNMSSDGNQLLVTWQPLQKSELNGPGFYYIVDWRGVHQQFGQMLTLVDHRQSEVRLQANRSLMPYEVMIQAGNEIGLGPFPEIITVGVEETGLAVPDAPSDVSVYMASPTSVNVTWTPLPQRESYGTVYGYRVVVQVTGSESEVNDLNCLSTTTSCVIYGLLRGTTYRVMVLASGDGGEGYSSVPVTLSLPGELAPVVKGLKVRAWSRTMLLRWSLPDGGEFEGYVVNYTPTEGEDPELEVVIDSPSQLSLKLGNLSPRTSYRVSIRAYNQVGRGEARSVVIQTKAGKTKLS